MKKIRFCLLFALLSVSIALLGACGIPEVDYAAEGYTAQVEFRFDGGILRTPTAAVNDYITYYYKPNALVVNPLSVSGYSMTRYDEATETYYECIGWFKDEECKIPWNFTSTRAAEGKVTLYAGWKRIIKYTYTLYYKDDDGTVKSIGEPYSVSAGAKFSDPQDKVNERIGYTPWIVGKRFYSDPDCQNLWDDDFVHPGGEDDTDVKVYVKYVKGTWSLVTDYKTLNSALTAGSNIWLINDIDCGGAEWSINDYAGEFDGKGHTVSNFKKTFEYPFIEAYVFDELGAKAKIKDVTFENVVYTVISQQYSGCAVAGFAFDISPDAQIENVAVNGKVELCSGASIAKEDDFTAYEPLTAKFIQDAFAKSQHEGVQAQITVVEKSE